VSVTSGAVSTRRLIAVALLCGLAILVAGGIQLFRISDRSGRTVEVLEEGQSATIGGVQVEVVSSVRRSDDFAVRVRLGAPGDGTSVPLSSFTLLVGGDLERAVPGSGPSACPDPVPLTPTLTFCDVAFPSREGTATLSFSHGGQQRLWHLAPASA
jgi:hypothetical protein